MPKITRCACLLAVADGHILLVRVRDNRLWYLPGGKIEPGENAVQAVCRETREELDIELDRTSLKFDQRVIGPDPGGHGQVELNCFTAQWWGQPLPHAEVSEVAWWSMERKECFAPAVRRLLQQRFSQPAVADETPAPPRRKP